MRYENLDIKKKIKKLSWTNSEAYVDHNGIHIPIIGNNPDWEPDKDDLDANDWVYHDGDELPQLEEVAVLEVKQKKKSNK